MLLIVFHLSYFISSYFIDPRHLPNKEEELTTYGFKKPTDFYGKEQCVTYEDNTGVSCPDIVAEQAEAEWLDFSKSHVQFWSTTDSDNECSGLQNVTSNLLTNPTLRAGYPNLVRLAYFLFCLLQRQL